MRWYIIRTLLYKEWLRHLADRGGIFLAILMVVATLLLSVFRKTDTKSVGFSTGIKGWHLVWYRGPWDMNQDYFRMASMGALAYMLTVGLFLYITEHFGIPSFRFIALEYYCPR